MSHGVSKKHIPHPSEVPEHHHEKVMSHIGEQFLNGHYSAKKGTVTVEDTENPKEKKVSFIRQEHGDHEPAPHGLDLS